MKKIFFLLGLVITMLTPNFTQGQDLSETIAKMYKKYLDENNGLADSLKSLYSQYKALRQEVNVNSNLLNNLTDKDILNAKTRYEKNTESIRKTAHFIESTHKSLGALEASLSATEYFTSISALNNPTNEELGFKLEEEMLSLIDKKIISKAKKFKSVDKFKRIVSNIINNPITNFVVSNVPAVNSISSVVHLVNGAVWDNDNLLPEDLSMFHKELKKYIEHYENLAKANNELSDNISNLNVKANALDKLLNDFIRTSAHDLLQKDFPKEAEKFSNNDFIRDYYNYAKVDAIIKDIEKEYTVNNRLGYEKMVQDTRLGYSVVGRQKVSFMAEQLEQLVNEYITALDQYHTNIVKVLEKATEISKDKNKVSNKIAALNKQYNNVKSSFESNVDIATVKRRLSEVPRY